MGVFVYGLETLKINTVPTLRRKTSCFFPLMKCLRRSLQKLMMEVVFNGSYWACQELSPSWALPVSLVLALSLSQTQFKIFIESLLCDQDSETIKNK